MSKQSRERREKWEKLKEVRDINQLLGRIDLFDACQAIYPDERYETIDSFLSLQGQWDVLLSIDDAYKWLEQYSFASKSPFPSFWVEMPMTIHDEFTFSGHIGAVVWCKNDADPENGYPRIGCQCITGGTDRNGVYHVMVEPVQIGLYFNDEGIVDEFAFVDLKTDKIIEPEDNFNYMSLCFSLQAAGLALKTIGLLNCQNINLVDKAVDEISTAEYQKRFGRSLTKYKTLTVRSIGKRNVNRVPSIYADVMPLHFRRGNFAHYNENAPLFGKYTGTFWRPATAVGNEKNGIIIKDYKVKA